MMFYFLLLSSWTSSVWPNYNGQAGIELQYSANSVRTRIDAGLDNVRKVTIIGSGAHDFVGRDKKFNALAQIVAPYKVKTLRVICLVSID